MEQDYKKAFQRVKARLGGRLEATKGAIALEAFSKIVRRTPVLTGKARGNWNLSVGTPDLTERRPAPTGQTSINRAKQVLGSNRSGAGKIKRIYIANGLPYILRLENGWSKQAPAGMVAITLAELPSLAGQIIATQLGAK